MPADIAEQLTQAGMGTEAAVAKARMLNRLTRAWRRWSRLRPQRAWWVPGRVELLGKHTDYAGGRSLLCAIDRGICLIAAPRSDGRVRMRDVAWRSEAEFALGEAAPAVAPWAIYPSVVAQRLARDFPGARRGADIVFASDLPSAAGMSSSSAMTIASFLGMAGMDGVLASTGARETWAGYLAAVESGGAWQGGSAVGGVGTHGGSEDHTAILCCRAGQWTQYRFCPIQHEASAAAPAGMKLILGVSGVVAEKTGAAQAHYNRAVRLAAAVLSVWNDASGRQDRTLGDAVACGAETIGRVLRTARHGEFSSAQLTARFEQFWLESEWLVPAATAAVAASNWPSFGALVARSQAAAERQLGNQVPETMALVSLARQHGAIAASAFGAGFGGAVWALAPEAASPAFLQDWQRAYRKLFALSASRSLFFESVVAPSALEIVLPEDCHAGQAVESA